MATDSITYSIERVYWTFAPLSSGERSPPHVCAGTERSPVERRLAFEGVVMQLEGKAGAGHGRHDGDRSGDCVGLGQLARRQLVDRGPQFGERLLTK